MLFFLMLILQLVVFIISVNKDVNGGLKYIPIPAHKQHQQSQTKTHQLPNRYPTTVTIANSNFKYCLKSSLKRRQNTNGFFLIFAVDFSQRFVRRRPNDDGSRRSLTPSGRVLTSKGSRNRPSSICCFALTPRLKPAFDDIAQGSRSVKQRHDTVGNYYVVFDIIIISSLQPSTAGRGLPDKIKWGELPCTRIGDRSINIKYSGVCYPSPGDYTKKTLSRLETTLAY